MNPNLIKQIADAHYQLADLYNQLAADSSDSVRSDAGQGSVPPAASSAPTFSDGMPVDEPPLFPDGFETFTTTATAPPSQTVTYSMPAQTERDVVLGRCPTHDVPWTIRAGGVSKAGKSYQAFWKCAERNDDDTWCQKKPVKDWVRVHDPEKALAAA